MPDYICKQPLLHNGSLVHRGNTITLTEEDAAPLVRIGALEPAPEPAPEPEASPDADAAPPPKKSGPKPKPESAA